MIASARKNERREHILQVFSQLFARQGYHGTSTRDIARVADLAEVTLFRYFQHKKGYILVGGGFSPFQGQNET